MSLVKIEQLIVDGNNYTLRNELDEYLKTHHVDDEVEFVNHSTILLFHAAIYNNFDAIKLLVNKYGANVNRIYYGRNVFMYSCYHLDFPIIKFLCEHGADIYTAKSEYPIERIASRNGSIEIVKYIFENYYDNHPEKEFGRDIILEKVQNNVSNTKR